MPTPPMQMPEGDWIEVEGLRVMAPTPVCATCGNDDIGGCPDCGAPLRDMAILDDVAQVLDMALGATHGAASVVAELRRVRARIGQVQERATVLG